jgi:hypothetical protein
VKIPDGELQEFENDLLSPFFKRLPLRIVFEAAREVPPPGFG